MFKFIKLLLPTVLVFVGAISPTSSAVADTNSAISLESINNSEGIPNDLLQEIESMAPELLVEPVEVDSKEDFIGIYESEETQVSIPVNPTNPFQIQSKEQLVEINYIGSVGSNFSRVDGKFHAETDSGSELTAVIGEETLQLITSASNEKEISTFSFKISPPTGGQAILENGQLFIFDQSNLLITYTELPWAVDSNGTRLVTHYEFEDNILTQIIDTPIEQISFPIIADPQFALYQGWAPSFQMNRSETYSLIGNPVRFCNWFTPISAAQCLLNAASISWNSRLNYEAGGCSWLVYAPGVTFTFRYYGGYCR